MLEPLFKGRLFFSRLTGLPAVVPEVAPASYEVFTQRHSSTTARDNLVENAHTLRNVGQIRPDAG